MPKMLCSTWLAALFALALLSGCSSHPRLANLPGNTLVSSAPRVPEAAAADTSDPLEGLNRQIYRFNFYADRYLLLPAVRTYQFLVPDYVEQRVSNFFDNLGEIHFFANAVLQLKGRKAVQTGARFLTNSTLGFAGLWDVATRWGIRRQPEDFGQTLGYYGVGPGPYLVLPFFGPSSLRDTAGLGVDLMAISTIDPLNLRQSDYQYPYYVLNSIDTRKRMDFRYYGTGNPFEYELVRFMNTKKRELEIGN